MTETASADVRATADLYDEWLGRRDVVVDFGGAQFSPEELIYADDGIVVLPRA